MGQRIVRNQVGGMVLALGTLAQAPATEPKPPKLDYVQMLEKLPRRVASKDGTPGDMVNFLLIGTREQVQQALKTAGWSSADRDTQEAAEHAVQETLANRGYVQMPMSDLFLFGRRQDFGYARALPLAVVFERHHFRIWRAPWLTADGKTVWVGAGTHDIGIERDPAGQLTHRIDPNVDDERAYTGQTLKDAGVVAQTFVLKPADPVVEAFTATGAKYTSDGRILVLVLKWK